MSGHTLIATLDEYGEVLSWVAVPGDLTADSVHSNGEDHPIHTYVVWVADLDPGSIEAGLNLIGEAHVIDTQRIEEQP